MKAGAWWPIAVVGVLAVTVGANIWLIFAARDPNAYVVEPNYYEKAVKYDSTLALARRSAALGWQVEASLTGWTAKGTPLVVSLADSNGAPVTGVALKAELINNLSPELPVRMLLRDAGDGRYTATAPLPRTGLWEIRLDGRRGPDEFVADLRRDVAEDAAK